MSEWLRLWTQDREVVCSNPSSVVTFSPPSPLVSGWPRLSTVSSASDKTKHRGPVSLQACMSDVCTCKIPRQREQNVAQAKYCKYYCTHVYVTAGFPPAESDQTFPRDKFPKSQNGVNKTADNWVLIDGVGREGPGQLALPSGTVVAGDCKWGTGTVHGHSVY